MEFAISRHVRRTPSEVYAFMADIQRYVRPDTPVPFMEKIPASETRVGTRWRELVRVLPFATMTVWTIVESIVPDRLMLSRFHSWWMQGLIEYTYMPEDGGTRFTWTETIWPRGPLRFLDGLMARFLRPRLAERMADLCHVLESGTPPTLGVPLPLSPQR